jgi:hypothetical protein
LLLLLCALLLGLFLRCRLRLSRLGLFLGERRGGRLLRLLVFLLLVGELWSFLLALSATMLVGSVVIVVSFAD